MNNIKETGFVNVTIQSLMRVTPLRNFFLIPKNYEHCRSPLVHRFGELTRKIWHARNDTKTNNTQAITNRGHKPKEKNRPFRTHPHLKASVNFRNFNGNL